MLQNTHREANLNDVHILKLRKAGMSLFFFIGATCAGAQEMHHHPSGSEPGMPSTSTLQATPPTFIPSTAKSFAALADDAMTVMDDGMKHAPMNGVVEHDF